jgi:dienelactone hydrolase
LLRLWTTILGKLGPNSEDLKWFGDIRQAVVHERTDRGAYTRTMLDLPIKKDFLRHHVLVEPKGSGPFPAVICWTSTTPDSAAPEEWWGKWLAEHGYLVLTNWSFIQHYRDGSTYRDEADAKLHERFGHWLPMARMVHDAQREAEYLRNLKNVDGSRIGCMGFSLSAKAAVYIGAFAPEFAATVTIDPHIAINGGTNWFAPWYLDWQRPFADIPTPQHTVRGTMVGFSRRRQARGSNGPCVRTIRTRTRPSWASSARPGCGLCPWNRNRKSSHFPWRPNKCASHRC